LYGIRCVCLRFFTVYGPRQRPDLAIHKFARLMTEGKSIPVFGDGTTRRDYTYIDDIIAGARAAINYDASNYEVINLGESRTVELRELISLLEKELEAEANIDRQQLQPGDVPQTFADITKARRLLAYDPQTQIEEGIKKFVEWFRRSKASKRLFGVRRPGAALAREAIPRNCPTSLQPFRSRFACTKAKAPPGRRTPK
jgi:UDP-glucuronate 4-epimerase